MLVGASTIVRRSSCKLRVRMGHYFPIIVISACGQGRWPNQTNDLLTTPAAWSLHLKATAVAQEIQVGRIVLKVIWVLSQRAPASEEPQHFTSILARVAAAGVALGLRF